MPKLVKCPRCADSDHGAMHACYLCTAKKEVLPEVATAYRLIVDDPDNIEKIYILRRGLTGLTMSFEEFWINGATRAW